MVFIYSCFQFITITWRTLTLSHSSLAEPAWIRTLKVWIREPRRETKKERMWVAGHYLSKLSSPIWTRFGGKETGRCVLREFEHTWESFRLSPRLSSRNRERLNLFSFDSEISVKWELTLWVFDSLTNIFLSLAVETSDLTWPIDVNNMLNPNCCMYWDIQKTLSIQWVL